MCMSNYFCIGYEYLCYLGSFSSRLTLFRQILTIAFIDSIDRFLHLPQMFLIFRDGETTDDLFVRKDIPLKMSRQEKEALDRNDVA